MTFHGQAGVFVSVIVPGLISQYRFAERIESVLFAIVARDSFHLLTPFPWGCRVDFSLSANMTPETPDSTRFLKISKNILKQVDFQMAIEKPSRPKTANRA